MPTSYQYLEGGKPNDQAEARIQQDIDWMKGTYADLSSPDAVFLANVESYVASSRAREATLLGSVSQAQSIFYTDRAILGRYELPAPLAQCTEDQLQALSSEEARTMLRLDMLKRIQAIVIANELLSQVDSETSALDPRLVEAIRNSPEEGMMPGDILGRMYPLKLARLTDKEGALRSEAGRDGDFLIIEVFFNQKGQSVYFHPETGQRY